MYGCRPCPRDQVDAFSSSTASSISHQAYARVTHLWHSSQHRLHAFGDLVEETRGRLKACLGLSEDAAEVVFAPSGTDAHLLALFLVQATLGAPMTCILAGSDQTGSGLACTARGRHFRASGRTGKGDLVEGLSGDINLVGVPFCDAHGNPRAVAEIDSEVLHAVQTAVSQGRRVLLQAMSSSKLGWAGPSQACLDHIRERWDGKVRIVLDACQMRTGNARIRSHLAGGDLVLITGSKYFGGPAFSGAVLVPAALRHDIAALNGIAPGLKSLTSRFDWPSCWPGLQDDLPATGNIGQWLRWEAALDEMRRYHAVPPVFRERFLRRFAQLVPAAVEASPHVTLYRGPVPDTDLALGDEFTNATIVSFRPTHRGGFQALPECASLHRLLNQDVSARIPSTRIPDRRLAAQACHVGQPVALGMLGNTAVLRISCSARLVTRCWAQSREMSHGNFDPHINGVRRVLEKITLLLEHWPQVTA